MFKIEIVYTIFWQFWLRQTLLSKMEIFLSLGNNNSIFCVIRQSLTEERYILLEVLEIIVLPIQAKNTQFKAAAKLVIINICSFISITMQQVLV